MLQNDTISFLRLIRDTSGHTNRSNMGEEIRKLSLEQYEYKKDMKM